MSLIAPDSELIQHSPQGNVFYKIIKINKLVHHLSCLGSLILSTGSQIDDPVESCRNCDLVCHRAIRARILLQGFLTILTRMSTFVTRFGTLGTAVKPGIYGLAFTMGKMVFNR